MAEASAATVARRTSSRRSAAPGARGSAPGSTRAPSRRRRRYPGPTVPRQATRYLLVPDLDGPRVRMGFGWFVLWLGATIIGHTNRSLEILLGLLLGFVAGLAAMQSIHAWRSEVGPTGRTPALLPVGVLAAAAPIAAVYGTVPFGVALLAAAGTSLLVGAASARSPLEAIANAGLAVRCWLLPALAGGSAVVVRDLDLTAGIALVLVVCAFDSGDFLVGSGSRNRIEGPLAGLLAIAVVGFVGYVLQPEPFDDPTKRIAWFFAVLAGLGCLLGQLLCSAALPHASARARALRRLDTLAGAGPVWMVGLWLHLG